MTFNDSRAFCEAKVYLQHLKVKLETLLKIVLNFMHNHNLIFFVKD